MSSTVLSGARFDVYRAVTDKIVKAIEAGAGDFVLPWHRKGPSIGRPANAATGQTYRGVNIVALWAEAHMAGLGPATGQAIASGKAWEPKFEKVKPAP